MARIKPLLPSWIFENQCGFIKGRGADSNFVIASEILNSMNLKKGKYGWFALKLDLEKAYDRMEWSFLKNCLLALDVDQHSITMIMNRVANASSTILVNGKKTESFIHSRGLRQGDPVPLPL